MSSLLRECVRALLTEAALTIESLPRSIGLHERDNFLALIDESKLPTIKDALLGGITVSDWGNFWVVNYVSAVKGYGPLLYRLAMELATENGSALMANPSGNTSLAKQVWRVFSNLSRDPANGFERIPTGEPMRPAFTLKAGDLSVLRDRAVRLTDEEHKEALSLVHGLEVGGRRPELDED